MALLPAAVGVPPISPVEVLILSPAGRVPELTLKFFVAVPPLLATVRGVKGVLKVPESPELGVVIDRAGDTVKDLWTVSAGLLLPSPPWVALIVQVPADTRLTVVPETVQTPRVEFELKDTLSPLEAVADRLNVPVPIVLLDSDPKVIVWLVL
jgi:hypothetical protein